MRVKIIVPVANAEWNDKILKLCKKVADSETEISVVNIKKGPVSIESIYDETYAAPYVIEAAKEAEKQGYDGIIIYCFGNPGLEAAREALKIPVIGIGEAAQIFGMIVGERFGIISTIENAVARHWRKAKILGSIIKLKSIKPLNIPVMEYYNEKKVAERAKKIAVKMIEEEGIDSIILGCGSMFGLKEELQKILPIPVIVPGEAAIKLIESLIKMGISHSKTAYMFPPKKEYL